MELQVASENRPARFVLGSDKEDRLSSDVDVTNPGRPVSTSIGVDIIARLRLSS